MSEIIKDDNGQINSSLESDATASAFTALSLDDPARRAELIQFFDGRRGDAIFQEYAVKIVEKHLTKAGLYFQRRASYKPLNWLETCWYLSRDLSDAINKVEYAATARETLAELVDFCLLTDGNIPWRIAILLDLHAVGLHRDKYILSDRIVELLPNKAKVQMPEMRNIFDEWVRTTAEQKEEEYWSGQSGY